MCASIVRWNIGGELRCDARLGKVKDLLKRGQSFLIWLECPPSASPFALALATTFFCLLAPPDVFFDGLAAFARVFLLVGTASSDSASLNSSCYEILIIRMLVCSQNRHRYLRLPSFFSHLVWLPPLLLVMLYARSAATLRKGRTRFKSFHLFPDSTTPSGFMILLLVLNG